MIMNSPSRFHTATDIPAWASYMKNYAAEADYQVIDLGKVTFTEPGDRTFQFLVTGHNPASQGFQFVLDYIDLGR